MGHLRSDTKSSNGGGGGGGMWFVRGFGVVFSGGFGGFRGADHEGLGSGISVKIGIWLSP